MGAKKQTQQRLDARRAQILAAATQVFARRGYALAQVADIAAVLKIGHGTVYRYFKDKRALFEEVVQQGLMRVGAIPTEDAPGAETLEAYREQMGRIGARLYTLVTTEDALFTLLLRETQAPDPDAAENMEAAQAMLAQFTKAYLSHGVERGFLRADLDLDVAAYAFNATTFEGARRILAAKDREAAKAAWLHTVPAMLLQGMAAR